MKTPIIVYMFSRREIESTDTSRFHENFRPGGTPPGVPIPLVEAMGNVMFVVDGYDDCPEDIYAIPEIRSFLKNLHSAWPCWLFFSDLDSVNLRVHTLCMLEDVQILREKQSGLTRTRYNALHLHAWLREGIPTFHSLCRMAGLRRNVIKSRLHDISAYFGVPLTKFHPGRSVNQTPS